MARRRIETKTCSRCGWEKPTTDFYRRLAAPDGLQAACKACSDAGVLTAIMKPAYVGDGEKPCATCKTVKSLAQFYRNKRRFDGHHHVCKDCMKPAQDAYAANPINRLRMAAGRKMRYPRKKAGLADLGKRRAHGLPKNWTYDDALAAQGGCCAICGRTRNVGKRRMRLAVDHCHKTGIVRGILCTHCNQALGQMQDSPDLLRKAADYLEKPPARCLQP